MYPVAILDDTEGLPIGSLLHTLLERAGFEHVQRFTKADTPRTRHLPALTLGANQTRILQAAGIELSNLGHEPDREQWRLSPSGYLVAELPLGKFYRDRYGAPLLNVTTHHLNAQFPASTLDHWTETLGKDFDLIVDARPGLSDVLEPSLWVSTGPSTLNRANATWLAPQAVAWQTSTPEHDAVYFLCREHPRTYSWHASMEEAAKTAAPCALGHSSALREHWVEGQHTFLGEGCAALHPARRETWLTGWEDAWVLSRMIENYEEDIADGLSEYQRYRRPRVAKIQRTNDELLKRYMAPSGARRGLSHIQLALSTRFLPEIAMQRIDWLYQYDCIRGFR